MRTVSKLVSVKFFNFADLTLEDQELITAAVEVRWRGSQAPYSKYWVGAAARSESGRLHIGCNVERVTWSETTHAEQNSIDTMVAQEGRGTKLATLAIAGAKAGTKIAIVPEAEMPPDFRVEDFCPACGHCLPIIWENCLGDPDVRLLNLLEWGKVGITTIGDAYPMRFGPESLGIDIRGE